MQNRLFPIHQAYPAEMAIAGRILLDYGELEIDLMNCVQVARKDLNAVFKTMFRTRGEKQRIEIADALGRAVYHALGLGTQFETMVADMQHCRKIRNQYAHAYWHNYGTHLCFVGLEDLARTHSKIDNLANVPMFEITQGLLDEQTKFIRYTQKQITFLNWEGRFLAGELSSRLGTAPQQLGRPDLRFPFDPESIL